MKHSAIIKKHLEKIGNQVYLSEGEWNSVPFSAYISPLWRKKSSAFEDTPNEVGVPEMRYYLYIGPYNHDIMSLGNEAVIVGEDGKYEFKRKTAVRINDEVIYYTGILREYKEAQYDEY